MILGITVLAIGLTIVQAEDTPLIQWNEGAQSQVMNSNELAKQQLPTNLKKHLVAMLGFSLCLTGGTGAGSTKGIIDIAEQNCPAGARQLVGKTGYDMVPETDAKCQWTFKDGVLTASPSWDSVITRESYRDFRMHLEFNVNHVPDVDPERDGNSGVYIQQRYEIQILNSYGVSQADYKPSYCGSLYRMKKPDKLVNKPAGQWQSYDIAFRAARFDGDKKVENARITVYQNQQLIHDDVSIPSQTGAGSKEGPDPGPIKLQGHQNQVRFRNVWIQVLDLDKMGHVPPPSAEESTIIDGETVKKWSAPYRNWHYYPDHVIPAEPNIKGFEKVHLTDVPTVFQLPGDKKWYMTFIGFDGKGYQSFVAESGDLVHWTNMRLAMGYGPKDSFDYGGVVLGAYLYEDYDIKAPRTLKKKNGKYFSLYGAYPRQGGYELRPGYEGVASSKDGLTWQRAKDKPILSVHQQDCGTWEKDCIYQPWLVEHEGKYYNFYNAANGHIEQMGLALSNDLLEWKRYEHNPVIPNGPKGSYNEEFSSDGKVFWDGDHWVNFFFGVGHGGAHIMVAFSRDLYHWTVDPDPIYETGGNPSGLDKIYAHKISLVWNQASETYYMFYNAVGNKGRGIGLITSKPLVNQ